MAYPAWPGGLPQNQFIAVADERQKGALRTAMDAGPAKMRRRFSAVVRAIICPIEMTGTQKGIFDTFFNTTLAEGALPFTWSDPATDATQNYRFTAPPKFTLDVGGEPGARLWKASLALEILP
jgi:hypothetical protein